MLLHALSEEAIALEAQAAREVAAITDPAAWSRRVRALWLDTLGIDDHALACDLDPQVTGRRELEDVVVENVHFQVAPGARLPANYWRPRDTGGPARPCIIYLCGHSPAGKWWYQPHARWLAQRGYPCLILDTIQIGESEGAHHGTFYYNRWHWTSLGYSPAAVEVQAARRGLDFLATRPEADASRCGLTGISGGATMSLFAAAADPRFAACAPHCVAGTVAQLLAERSLDTHCDCATWVNRHRLGLAHIAALVAPQALLMSFSALDALCTPQPMRDLVAALKPLWKKLGRPDAVDTSEDDIPHAYSDKICRRILQWMNTHLRGDNRAISDAEAMPFKDRTNEDRGACLPSSDLCAFVDVDHPPQQQRMLEVDRTFIRAAGRPALPTSAAEWAPVRAARLTKLKATTFADADAAASVTASSQLVTGREAGRAARIITFAAEHGLSLTMTMATPEASAPRAVAHVVGPCSLDNHRGRVASGHLAEGLGLEFGTATVAVRGTAQTALGKGNEWFFRRGYPLVGGSLPQRQTLDLVRGLHLLRQNPRVGHVAVYGRGPMALVAMYAGLLGPADEVILQDLPATHWDGGPEFPGVLRVGDVPANLALWFPRPITFIGTPPAAMDWVVSLYAGCGKREMIRTLPGMSAWTPGGAHA